MILKRDFVSLGTKVTLTNQDGDVYHSVVQEVNKNDDVKFKIGALTKYGVFVKQPVGTKFSVNYMSGVSGFEFEAELTANQKLDNLNVVALKRISKIERNQKRENFRVEHLIPVKLVVYDMFDLTEIAREVETSTFDISEKGVGVLLDQSLDNNRFVDVYLNLDDEEVVLRCSVARSIRDDDVRATKYRIGMTLLEENEEVQRKIRKFIYKIQINQNN